jgi:hypothetical protein
MTYIKFYPSAFLCSFEILGFSSFLFLARAFWGRYELYDKDKILNTSGTDEHTPKEGWWLYVPKAFNWCFHLPLRRKYQRYSGRCPR